MDRWDRTVNFKATGNIGEDADDEDPEVYLTRGMVDEEEIQESRYDVMRSSLLEDPELELSYPPFLDLIKTHEWNHCTSEAGNTSPTSRKCYLLMPRLFGTSSWKAVSLGREPYVPEIGEQPLVRGKCNSFRLNLVSRKQE